MPRKRSGAKYRNDAPYRMVYCICAEEPQPFVCFAGAPYGFVHKVGSWLCGGSYGVAKDCKVEFKTFPRLRNRYLRYYWQLTFQDYNEQFLSHKDLHLLIEALLRAECHRHNLGLHIKKVTYDKLLNS